MNRIFSLVLALGLMGIYLAFGITQEVPLGGAKGRLTMKESGKPLADALVTFTPLDEEDETVRSRFATTKDDGSFAIANLAAGQYIVSASATAHQLGQCHVIVAEGPATSVDLELKPNEPYLRLYASQRVFSPDETPKIEMHGFVLQDSVSLDIYRLDVNAVARKGGFQQTISPLANPDRAGRAITSELASEVDHIDYRIRKKDAEGTFVEPLDLPKLGEGFYLVQCRGQSQVANVFLNITRLALITKSDGKAALCMVVDIKTGRPISGASIEAQTDGGLKPFATTDAQGLATAPVLPVGDHAAIVARLGKSLALNALWTNGEQRAEGNNQIFTYADRPIYRPGDLVQFKSVIRRQVGTEYRLPAARTATVRIEDPEGTVLEQKTLPISRRGSLHGDFRTSREATPGVYQIVVGVEGQEDTYYVNLAAYRKPEFSITVTPTQPKFVMGEKVRATVECQHFFGGPVVGARVVASAFRTPRWSGSGSGDDAEDEGESEEPGREFHGGDYVGDASAVTDANGRATIEFATATDPKSDGESDFSYSIEADVTDEGDRHFNGTGTVLVTRGGFDLDASVDTYVASPGDSTKVTLRTRTTDQPSKPVSGRTVTVEVGQDRWTQMDSVFVPLRTLKAVTDANGIATLTIPIDKPGSLHLRASTIDDGSRLIRDDAYVYVAGSQAEAGPNAPKLSVTLDHPSYKIGDTAKALIQTDRPGGIALVTVEADRVIRHMAVELTTSSTMVSLPLTREEAPNAFVAVAYVRGKEFGEASRQIVVDREDRKLLVSVEPDRPTAKPGETVEFRIRTRDSLGRAVPAELSLGVVDEGIYALRADSTNIAKGLFPRRTNRVQTLYSFPEVYLDGGDKAGGNVKIRSNFRDTADWIPNVVTDAVGEATVKVRLPDNLTKWRATVVGATVDSAGMAVASVQVRKDLMVRIQNPQFMVKGDRQTITVVVTNESSVDRTANFSLASDGLTPYGTIPKTIDLKNGEPVSIPVEFSASAVQSARITAKVWIPNGPEDGVESRFPIVAKGRLATTTRAMALGTTGAFSLDLEPSVEPSAGRLQIAITPSVAAGLVQSLDGLVEFPYGCVEQTLSRFLPAVVVTRLIRNTPVDRPDLQRKVPAIAADGFARLAKMQHSDGGWGWWEYDESDPFMTAWVLDGLGRLKAAGYDAPPGIKLEAAVACAVKMLKEPPKSKERARASELSGRLFLGYALGQRGEKAVVAKLLAAEKPDGLGASELAYAALAADAIGENDRRDGFLTRLEGKVAAAKLSTGDDWRDPNEIRAIALQALVTLRPDSSQIDALAQSLMAHRGPDGWDSTRSTAIAILGLSRYLTPADLVTRPSEVTVLLNGRQVRRLKVGDSAEALARLTVEVPVKELQSGANTISFRRTGQGRAFVSANLQRYISDVDSAVAGGGFTVERKYYTLESRKMEDGTLRLRPSRRPISQFTPGQIIRCEITIKTDGPEEFVLVEEPLPSNCRVTDREDPDTDGKWLEWWSRTVILDDRIAFFSRRIDKGIHVIRYTMQAEAPGSVNTMATRVSNMYNPEQVAWSATSPIEVKR